MRAQAGEVYTVYNQYLKRYTACQVAYIVPPDQVSRQPLAVLLSLDWAGDAPLTAEELSHLRPLYKDFMYWSRKLHLLRVPAEVPPQYTLVGTLPPFTDEPCKFYGGWDDGYEVYRQMRWQTIPKDRRRAFKEAMKSDEQTEIGGIQLKFSSHRVMDQYAPFDSALELKALPCLSTLICERWHPDLLEFLRENPFVDEVTLLNHGQRTLDLRGTSIRKLMLDMTGLEELWLCEGTEQLLFQNKGPDACTIHAPEDGDGLTLQFIEEYRPHTELPNLWGLHGIQLKDFDLTGLAAVHPHLKELRFLCERGIRFSAEDMLATIKSEKEEHGALDIETIRSIDVPSYVSGRSYSHLGEIAKYRKRALDQIIRYAGYLEQIHAPAEYLEQVKVLQKSVSDLTIKTKDLKPFRFRLRK